MKEYVDPVVKCPFYRQESPCRLHCEGVQPGMGTQLAFDTHQGKKAYKKGFCKADFTRCLLAGALYRKWGM